MNKLQKGFSKYFIVGLVILVFSGIGFYLWQQVSLAVIDKQTSKEDAVVDETANWKIYINEKDGFEIKYPDSITFEEISYGIKFVPIGEKKYTEQPHPAIFLLIHSEKVNPQESLENLIKKRFNLKELNITPWTTDMGIDMIEKFTFANNSSGYLMHQWIQAYGECHYFLQQEDILIDIFRGETGLVASSCKNDSAFNQILSTFKFINIASTPNQIIISSPVAGDKWTVGQTYQIKWVPVDSDNAVGIILSDTRMSGESIGKVWQVDNISNTGEYSFTVPQLTTGDKYQFYMDTDNGNIYGYGDLFSIVDETANWKTYRSEDYNFEIKYPPEASMEIGYEGNVFNMLFPNEGAPINIHVYQNQQGYTLNSKELNQWIEKNDDLDQKVLEELELIKIDNTDAIKYFANELGSPSPHAVLISKGKFIYKINAYIYETSLIDDIIFNQILSTFKFLD